MTDTPLIKVDNLSFRYGSENVLENVSFDIHAGEFVGIIGPNGSGKTTLLKLLLGLLPTQQGSIQIFGKSVQIGTYGKYVGYIPQKVTQSETRFPITVREVVALGRVHPDRILQPLGTKDKKLISEAISAVELSDFSNRLLSELSGGQQQRVFIAKALASEPKLLILDEPTVGIDVQSQETFYRLLSSLNKDKGLTIVIVSHDVDVVMNEVTTVLCLNKTLIYHGNPKTFLKEEYLEQLYGKNRRFIIHGH
ncbi:MAG: metal ABC transporter ATP-binding protein [Candidatus Woesebacteria bacterium]